MVRIDFSKMMERMSDTLPTTSLSLVCSLVVILGVSWVLLDYAKMLTLHRKMVSNDIPDQLTCIS